MPFNTIEEVVSGKNLLPTGTKFTGGANQWYDIDGNVMSTLEQIQTSTNYIDLKPNTTYKFFAHEYDNIANMQVIYLDSTNTIKTYVNSVISTGISTFTTTDYTRVYVRVKASASANNTYFIGQLEEGTSSTPYEPYITPTSYQLSLGDIQLNAIGSYKDELIYDVVNDKVYKNEKIGKYQFTGNENFGKTGATNLNGYVFNFSLVTTNILSPANNTLKANILSNAFITKAVDTIISEATYGIGIRSDKFLYIGTPLGSFENVSELQTYLANNITFMYYALITPVLKEITDTTLKTQIKALYNAQSNNGTTIIQGNGNLPMIIKVRALKGE